MSSRSWLVVVAAGCLVAGWVARAPDQVVPEVVVRWVRAPGRVREVQVPDRATADCSEQDRLAIALLGLPDDVPLPPPATESACRARVELATALATARQLDEAGRPRPFPADLPAQYREAGVEAVARRVLATCPELGLDLRHLDCAEYPCMAWFVGPGSPTACPAWAEAYGDGTFGSDTTMVGPDGARIHVQGLEARAPAEVVPPDPEPTTDPSGAIHWNNDMLRIQVRGTDGREAMMTELGAHAETEEEQREDERDQLQQEIDQGNEAAAAILEMREQGWAIEDEWRRGR